jgi:hypothetical protein
LGNKFRDAFKKGSEQGTEYHKLKRTEAAAFRLQWCKKELKVMTEKYVHKRAWTRVDRTRGTYKPFGRMVIDWGGWTWPEAISGSVTAAHKCLAMGAPWIQKHPQSDIVEFLILENSYQEDFVNSWAEFKETVTNKGTGTIDKGTTDPDKKDAGSGKIEDDDKNPDKTELGKKNGGEKIPEKTDPGKKNGGKKIPEKPSPAKQDDDDRKRMADLVKEAMKIKGKFQAASSSYVQLHQTITSEPAWDWVKNSPRMTELDKLKGDVQAMLNPWHREFVTNNDASAMAAVKKKYSNDRITVELQSFVRISNQVEQLATMTARIYTSFAELNK